MKEYNVGDRVTIRSDLEVDVDYGNDIAVEEMMPHAGKEATITGKDELWEFFHIDIDPEDWNWTAEMFA